MVAGCAAGGDPVVCIFFGFAVFTFGFVFGFAVGYGLPLHIVRCVSSATGQRDNMIDYVAWAAAFVVAIGRAWVLVLKGGFSGLAALSGFGLARNYKR